jgi:hypothetical protein
VIVAEGGLNVRYVPELPEFRKTEASGLGRPAAMLSRRAALGVDQARLVSGDDELYPVDGLVTVSGVNGTTTNQPTGTWWLDKWYGDMTAATGRSRRPPAPRSTGWRPMTR